MLLSIHVPKAAGNSFREGLMYAYGDRLFRDYGDWAGFDTPEANARRDRRMGAMRERREELLEKYDAIHGHFIADKYVGLFPEADFIALFRDPYQQAIAHYNFVRRNTKRESDVNKEVHPEVALFNELNPTLLEYIEWPYYRDHQSQFLGSLSIDDLAFVGLSEEYDLSLELFKARFGRCPGPPRYANVNTENAERVYEVTSDVRQAVRKYRARDLELYARAKEIFDRQRSLVAA
jgi:hypothetical protein